MYKILSFDGGGIRSVLQARLIERLELQLGHPIKPDLYAGTSGGAIVSCGLQFLSPRDVITYFRENGPTIFKKDPLWKDIGDLWNLTSAKYENRPLKESLLKVFGDQKIKDLKTSTLITSFDLRSPTRYWEPVVFHNMRDLKSSPELPLVDAIMRSTAAPTYFPVYQNHCDGGVWGNNPSMAAIAAALDPYVGKQKLEDIVLISLGTGRRPAEIMGAKRSLGALDWYKNNIIDVLMDGGTEASHYYARSVLGTHYARIQIDLDFDIHLDDVKYLEDMVEIADRVDLDPLVSWMSGFWL